MFVVLVECLVIRLVICFRLFLWMVRKLKWDCSWFVLMMLGWFSNFESDCGVGLDFDDGNIGRGYCVGF